MKPIRLFSFISLTLLTAVQLFGQQPANQSKPGSLIFIPPAKDTTPPTIEIVEPADFAKRGMKNTKGTALVTASSTLRVRGLAKDSSGVARVVVNGEESQLKQAGDAVEFGSAVLLALGDNEIEIKASDKLRNESSLKLFVRREEALIKGKYFAIVIGVQNYKDRTINSLDYPLKDAENVVNTLNKEYTFEQQNIVFLKDPDRRTIINAFDGLRKRVTADDNLLIFYAGHGIWDEELRQGYWLPSNATSSDQSEWLPNSTVRDYIRGIKAKHTLLLADACFSGGIFKTREAFTQPDASIQKTYQMPSRGAITSGALKNVPDRSVFVEYLLKRLKENQETYLSAMKLYVSMKDAVINNSPSNQTPLYGVINESGDEGGDFIFVRR
jgi:hypothetical protein